jgi:hypothetical protein
MIDMSGGYDTFSYFLLAGGVIIALAHLVALYVVATWFWTGNPRTPWPQRKPKPYEQFPTPRGSVASSQRAHCIRGRIDVWANPSRVLTDLDCGCVHCQKGRIVIRSGAPSREPAGVY